MARRPNRSRGLIRLSGKPKPPPPKPKRKPEPAPPEPPPRQRRYGVSAPFAPPAPRLEPLSPSNRNGMGPAKYDNAYGTSRYCGCVKPMVVRDKDAGRFDEATEDRCLLCGKPRGATNATVNHSRPALPDGAE